MSLPNKTVQAIMRAGSAQPDEISELALELLNRRRLDWAVDIHPVPVCLQPVMDDDEDSYGCKIIDDRSGEERHFVGWFATVDEAVDEARLSLDGEREESCNDLLVLT